MSPKYTNMEMPYFLEKTLPKRVREYMDTHDRINVDYMTEYLIENHTEFKMKKFKVFKKSVNKAYSWELQQKQSVDDPKSNGSNNLKLDDEVEVVESTPSLNKSPVERHKKKRKLNNDVSVLLPAKKNEKGTFKFVIPDISIEDAFGIEPIVEKILEMYLNFHPSMIDQTAPSKSVLVMGPKGAGKTFLINAVAGSNKIPVITVSMEELLHGEPGSSSGCDLLEAAFKEAIAKCPCIFHLSDLHVISTNNVGSTKWIEKRLIKTLESNITALNESMKEKPILVIGEYRYSPTQSIDFSLKSCFDDELFIPALQKKDRLLFIKSLTSTMSLDDTIMEDIAKNTPSFLPGDLVTLVRTVKKVALRRYHQKFRENVSAADYLKKCSDNLKKYFELKICEEDFTSALKIVVPVLKQDGFPTVPEVSMADIGGMENLKLQIYDTFLFSIERPDLARAYSKSNNSSGILLWGPPGCGKTLIAKAVANEAGINFLLINGAEVLKMYQGESERTIREAFALAKSVSPCVIYFDEFEGICPTRTSGTEGGSKGTIVTTLLSELNGVQSREGVYVMASTNRPDVIDPALLRPGRFDVKLYVGLPDANARKAIFLTDTANGTLPNFDSSVNLDEISSKCRNFSGADCSQLIKVASLHAQKNYTTWGSRALGTLYAENFEDALEKVKPSVSAQAMAEYTKLNEKYTNSS